MHIVASRSWSMSQSTCITECERERESKCRFGLPYNGDGAGKAIGLPRCPSHKSWAIAHTQHRCLLQAYVPTYSVDRYMYVQFESYHYAHVKMGIIHIQVYWLNIHQKFATVKKQKTQSFLRQSLSNWLYTTSHPSYTLYNMAWMRICCTVPWPFPTLRESVSPSDRSLPRPTFEQHSGQGLLPDPEERWGHLFHPLQGIWQCIRVLWWGG